MPEVGIDHNVEPAFSFSPLLFLPIDGIIFYSMLVASLFLSFFNKRNRPHLRANCTRSDKVLQFQTFLSALHGLNWLAEPKS